MNYKVIIISFIVMFFILGTVSANEQNSTDALNDIANVKEIYVNDTGNDLNTGSSDSPYASIGKAIGDVDDSDDATIYISKGTFLSENDADFDITFNHKVYGGSLRFIGAGVNETILDGQSASRFAKIGPNSNITFINLTFINFKGKNGGTFYTEGVLNIDNCSFMNSYAVDSQGGAIFAYLSASEVYVRNSEFISCSVNGILNSKFPNYGGGAIFANSINLIYLENNTFINTRVNERLKGFAINIDNMDIIDYSEENYGRFDTKSFILNNKFINITANEDSYDAGIYICGGWSKNSKNTFIEGNEFINCTNPSDKYSIVFVANRNTTLANNTFINSGNSVGNIYLSNTLVDFLNISIENHPTITNFEINNGLSLLLNITDDMGNIVKLYGYGVEDKVVRLISENNSYIYKDTLGHYVDFQNNVPEPGNYTLIVTFCGVDYDSIDISVIYNDSPVELWVSPNGRDLDNGTIDDPFETIEYAVNFGFGKSFNVIIHLLEGNYTGDCNVELTISNIGFLQIIGENKDNVVIDGEGSHWFLRSDTNITIRNVKFVNGYSETINLITTGITGSSIFLDNCIIDKCRADKDYILRWVSFDNLIYTNNMGLILASDIPNSYFENNTNHGVVEGLYNMKSQGGIIRVESNSINIVNSTFINNSAEHGGVLWVDSHVNITSLNSYYAGNHAQDGGVFYIRYGSEDSGSYNKVISHGDTFIGNYAINNGVIGFETNDFTSNMGYTNPALPDFEIINAVFANNSAQKAGALVMQKGTIINSSFVSNTANYGGAIVVVPNTKRGASANKVNLENVTFRDNSAGIKGNDIYLDRDIDPSWYKNQALVFALPLNITFNDLSTGNLSDYLTCEVYGPCGAIIGGSRVNFNLNDINVGYCELVNSKVRLRYNGFDAEEFVLSGDVDNMDQTSIVNNGIITVDLSNYVSSKEIWVSGTGSDANGDGSRNNPFKTIGHAIVESTYNCINVTIHIESGTYSGELNTALEVSSRLNLTLKGENTTVLDGENTNWFIKVLKGNNKITICDLTIKNMGIKNGTSINPIAPITIDEGGNLCLKNVLITDNHGGEAIIKNDGNLEISDSSITKNGFSTVALISGGNVKINNTSMIDNFGLYGSFVCEHIVINNSIIRNSFNMGDFLLIEGDSVLENTIILNDGDNSSLKSLGLDEVYPSLAPAVSLGGNVVMKNVSMINNYRSPLNVPEYVGNNYVFLSIIAYSRQGYSGREFTALDCSFYNFKYIWALNEYGDLNFNFNRCVFKNITQICKLRAVGSYSKWVFTNSVFLDVDLYFQRPSYFQVDNPTQVSHSNGINNIPYENNFWASNDKPVIRYADGNQIIFNYSPKNWIVLKNVNGVLKLQLTNGRTVRDYNGDLPLSIAYAFNNGEMIPVIIVDGKSYPISFIDGNIQIGSDSIETPILKPVADNTLLTSDLTVTYGDEARFTARFLYPGGDALDNTNVSFTINSMSYTAVTDENGSISFDVNFDSEVYEVVTVNPVSNQINVNSIVVNKAKPVLTVSNVNAVYNDGKYLTVNVNAPGTVNIVLNGKTITKTVDGKNPVKIPITLAPKTYTATITYNGNVNYAKASTTAIVKVTKATPKLTVKKATFKAKTKKYTITLKDNRNKAMKKAKVTLKVKGKTYKATTNAKGKATFKLTKLTKKGKYTAKVKFAGNKCYKAKSVKVKITVK